MPSIKDILLYSPYDNKFDLTEKEFSEEFFIDKLLYVHPIYHTLKKIFDESFDVQSNTHSFFSILCGYSGSGKTTFLNWYKSQTTDKYFYNLNLVKNARGVFDCEKLIKLTLRDDFLRLPEESQLFNLFLNNKSQFMEVFTDKIGEKTFIKILEEYDHLVNKSSEINNPSDKSIHFKQWGIELYNDMPFLYLLVFQIMHIILEGVNNGYKKIVISFDNLDELNLEYITKEIWEVLYSAFDIIWGILKNKKIKFQYNGNTIQIDPNILSLFLILREANFSISNAQRQDRSKYQLLVQRLVLNNAGPEILNKRFDYINKNLDLSQPDGVAYTNITKILQRDEIFEKDTWLPLFNYDFRSMFQTTLKVIVDKNSANRVGKIFNVTFSDYESIFVNQYQRNLSRGILINAYLQAMFKDHLKDLIMPPTEKGCKYARLLLTIIFRLCHKQGVEEDIEVRNYEGSMPTNLYEIIVAVKRIIPFSNLKDIFNTIYNTKEDSSYAHFITIYNLRALSNGKLDFREVEVVVNKLYESNSYYPSSAERELLEKIEIRINSSGFCYLRYILTNFEYSAISIYDFDDKFSINYQPLYKQINIQTVIDKDGNKVVKYEFEEIIERIYSFLVDSNKCVESDFKKHFSDFTPESYLNSKFAFLYKKNKLPFFYMTRLVTTHISYIDSFRRYLFSNTDFEQMSNKKNQENPRLKNHFEVQEYLLIQCLNYIKLLDSGILDPNIKRIKDKIKETISATIKKGNETGDWRGFIRVD